MDPRQRISGMTANYFRDNDGQKIFGELRSIFFLTIILEIYYKMAVYFRGCGHPREDLPAGRQAGIQSLLIIMDSRLRGNDD